MSRPKPIEGARGAVGRADLIYCLADVPEAREQQIAALLGYQLAVESLDGLAKSSDTQERKSERAAAPSPTPTEPQLDDPAPPSNTQESKPEVAAAPNPPPIEPRADDPESPSAVVAGAPFLRLVGYRPVPAEERVTAVPAEIAAAAPLPEHEPIDYGAPTPAKPPLAPWSRLWPFLRTVLGERRAGRPLDLARIVRCLAEGRTLRRLPRRDRPAWARRAQLLVDASPHLFPLQEDFDALCRRLIRLRGAAGLTLWVLADGPGGACQPWGDHKTGYAPHYRPPEPGTPVLVLGDLGQLSGRTGGWLRLGRRLRRAGCRPRALAPCPPRLWQEALTACYQTVAWDRGQRLPLSARRPPTPTVDQGAGEAGGERLLRLLALAIRVEPALLRAIRYLLPQGQADVATEAAVWGHRQVSASLLGMALRPEVIEAYREAARRLESPALLARVAALITAYHAPLPRIVTAEEAMVQAQLLGRAPPAEALALLRSMAVTVLTRPPGFPHQAGIEGWVRRMATRQHQAMWRWPAVQPLAGAVAALLERDSEVTEVAYPPGFDRNRVLWAVEQGAAPVEYELRLRQLLPATGSVELQWAAPEGADDRRQHQAERLTQRLASLLRMASRRLSWAQRDDADGVLAPGVTGGVQANNLTQRLASLSMTGTRLPWTHQDRGGGLQQGLTGEIRAGARFALPASGSLWLHGTHESLELALFHRPAWAERIGVDRHGLWAEFAHEGVTQRLRWIGPGRFMMGSPPGEEERNKDEQLHEVSLTRGYWLADTPCIQALWAAAMGENPSRFKGAERPVEQVSWEDAARFIERLNAARPGLELRLPTEAEWEYACRAGRQTQYWFGDTISAKQVNFRNRQQGTVEVKALPCNGWGLYQMHGNVWEWCQDWYGDYPPGPVTDPRGAEAGGRRVLRGGSWFDGAWGCRSACRFRGEPGSRNDDIGFRLARGRIDRVGE